MYVGRVPPMIKHVGGRPSQEAQGLIVDQALSNFRMPKAARKLMMYYASCATGFRPSLKTIDDITHVGIKNISTVRQYLVNHGFIAYTDGTILIDWLRLKAFASLDPKLMGRKKCWRITPVNPAVVCKTQVHNYYRAPREEDKIRIAYEALNEAIQAGIHVPGTEEFVRTQVAA